LSDNQPPPIDRGPIKPSPEARSRLTAALRARLDGLCLLNAACELIHPGQEAALRKDVGLRPAHGPLAVIRTDAANALLGALIDGDAHCELRFLPRRLDAEFIAATATVIRTLNCFAFDLAKSEIVFEREPFPAKIFDRAADDTSTVARAATESRSGKSRRGPAPGTVRRYDKSDRSLFPDIERLRRDENISTHAAALRLAEAGEVAGNGAPPSRAKRLAGLYIADRRPKKRSD
jgi:hypothetical protein